MDPNFGSQWDFSFVFPHNNLLFCSIPSEPLPMLPAKQHNAIMDQLFVFYFKSSLYYADIVKRT